MIMKKSAFFLSLLLLFSFGFVACEKDGDTQIIDPNVPTGTFTVARSGDFVPQNSTPTSGMASVGMDSDGDTFLRFNSGFTTELGTGTVTVYLSTSDTYMADPANGNPNLQLVGIVSQNGENFFKLSGPVAAKFTHVIIWCGSANIPFGYAPLQ